VRRWKLLLALPPFALLSGCVSLRPFEEVRRGLPAESFVPVDGGLVHVERAGSGEPVVLLHGFGASSYGWRKVLPGLAQGYQVAAPDFYGFGYTERPTDPAKYTREGQAAMVLGLLDALGIERAHFVGSSYGGAITLWIASRHPERVRSMILVDSAAPTYPDDRRSRLATRPFGGLFVRLFALRPGAVRRGLETAFYDDSLATPELAQAYLERLRIEGLDRAYYGLTAPIPGPRPRVDLATIDVPALVVWGTEDKLVPVALGRRAAATLPRGEFVALEKTGHLPMEERPEELLRLMTGFLARVSERQGG
jgi:pimeloyl-ACP methyl ester carboxylesterase